MEIGIEGIKKSVLKVLIINRSISDFIVQSRDLFWNSGISSQIASISINWQIKNWSLNIYFKLYFNI